MYSKLISFISISAKLDGVKSMGKARVAAHESIEDWLETERGQGHSGATDKRGKRRVTLTAS